MALEIEYDGDQAATISTEHTLATITGADTRVLVVDLSPMVAGDSVTLRIKTAVRAGGTERVAYTAIFAGATAVPIAFSPPVPMPTGGTVTLQQTAGTGRTYPWAVYAFG
ncbi:hypothetical protein AB0B94_30670 [Micromonospora sp. NPDC048986]|uniref:hypothetical protein n=1 Tax=Micromonospora sp. NPDC048986 TaxID=3155644 RepID=UPI0033F7CBED